MPYREHKEQYEYQTGYLEWLDLEWLNSHIKDSHVTEDQLYHAALLIHEAHGSLELAERILEKVARGEAVSGA